MYICFRAIAAGALIVLTTGFTPVKMNDVELLPLNDEELSLYRGGFSLNSNYVVNIGLSVMTSINGNTIFNSHIADIVIRNGKIMSSLFENGVTKVAQVGENNHFAPRTPETTLAEAGIESPSTQITTEITKSAGLKSLLPSHVIQNTENNNVIGLNTVVNIESQASGALSELRSNMRLQEALQMQHY